jgi:hypothetical protein
MKPSYVNFFDGMRVSAEHMDHLQGSLHSAIGDLRGIAGAGRVQEGFEVVANADGMLTVQPGLAFDRERNRIVSDEPRLVSPVFANGSRIAYVCVEYASSSTGVVDDVPTLIWDACKVVVRPDAPAAEETQIALARIRRAVEGGGIEVETLASRRAAPARPAPAAPPGAEPAATAATPILMVQQGIARLASPNGGMRLAEIATRLGEAPGTPAAGNGGEAGTLATVLVPAGRTAAPLPFLWRGLSCRVLLRLAWSADPAEAGAGPGHLLLGEASYGPEGLRQHAVQTALGPVAEGEAAGSIAADALGSIPLTAVARAAGSGSPALDAVLEQLEWRFWVTPETTEGVEFKTAVCWKGGTDEQVLRALAESTRALVWEATLAWKALGMS